MIAMIELLNHIGHWWWDWTASMFWQFHAMTIWFLGTLTLGTGFFLRLHSVAGRQRYCVADASVPQSFYNHLADCSKRLGLRRIPRVVVTERLSSPAMFGVCLRIRTIYLSV
jgi:hypothetical protein